MEIIAFDLSGKMAHFRKYYTNSSSLSYYFPPRTTIIGLIAGLLGFERDSYYEIFSPEKTKISLIIKSPLRKITQTINYIWANDVKYLNSSKGQHTQVPFEIVLPQDIKENICYRIFFYHKDKKLFDNFKEKLKTYTFCFPPYLGITEFIGNIEFIGEGFANKVKDKNIELDSIINVDFIKKNNLNLETYIGAHYVKEKMPFSFDKNRSIKDPAKEFIGELKNSKILLKGDVEFYKISVNEKDYNIVFMED